MLTFTSTYGYNAYSQFNEDGIIAECLKRIKPKKRTCVEFGGHDGYFCSNTRKLINDGWDGRMYDINPGHPEVIKAEITPENVNEIVGNPTVLSIDCDNPDYNIWKAYTGTPDIVIIEVNSSIPPTVDMIPGDRGASYKSMVELGQSKGYFLLSHTANCLFILDKYKILFPEVVGDPIKNHILYFNAGHL